VLDFGLARALDGDTRLTGTGMPLGTPAYMSPEQIAGAETVDARADIYGLGCVLYEMLTGRPPFVATSVVTVLRGHLAETPRPPGALKAGIPAELDRAVLKMLAKDPAQRYQTIQDALKDLEHPSGSRELAALPPPKTGILSRWFGKRSD